SRLDVIEFEGDLVGVTISASVIPLQEHICSHLLRPPRNTSRGFWVSWHSPSPTRGPRARSARLLGRRTPRPRIETVQGRPPVFRALVLSRTASARLRTARRERRKTYACASTRKCFSGEPFARQPVPFAVGPCPATLFSHGVKNGELVASPKP